MVNNSLPATGYVRLRKIIGDPKTNTPPVIPVKRSTIYAWIAAGKFPAPVKFGRVSAWDVEAIRTFLEHNGI